MDWFNKIVGEVVKAFTATTAAGPTVNVLNAEPSEVIKALQHLLNQFVKPNPPLNEDGWLGPRTEAAIGQAIEMAKPYLAFLGIR